MFKRIKSDEWMMIFLLILGILFMVCPLLFPCTGNCATVQLEWKTVENADGYRVYFGEDIAKLNHSVAFGQVTTGTIDHLECGTTYHFQVKSYNTAGESVPTNTITETMPDCPELPTLPDGWEVDGLIIRQIQ